MKIGALKRLDREAARAGLAAMVIARGAVLGTRQAVVRTAGDAPNRMGFGVGPRSVWQGPKHILSGAPVLRRY